MLDAKLQAGHSGYDVVVPSASPFLGASSPSASTSRSTRRSSRISRISTRADGAARQYDPGNAHAIPWMSGTTGIGYNVVAIEKRMPDAPVDSLKMVFDPAILAKFKDCGVMMLDSATDVFPAALNYLGLDPDCKKTEDIAKAADLVKAVRPYIRKFHSSEYINDLANGDICVALGYLGRHHPGARPRGQGQGQA